MTKIIAAAAICGIVLIGCNGEAEGADARAGTEAGEADSSLEPVDAATGGEAAAGRLSDAEREIVGTSNGPYAGRWRLVEYVGAPGVSSDADAAMARSEIGSTILIGDRGMINHDGKACRLAVNDALLLSEFDGGSFGGSWQEIGMRRQEEVRSGVYYAVHWIDAWCDGDDVTAEEYFAGIGEGGIDEMHARRYLDRTQIYIANNGELPLYGVFGHFLRMERVD